jgi:hypothetical protein
MCWKLNPQARMAPGGRPFEIPRVGLAALQEEQKPQLAPCSTRHVWPPPSCYSRTHSGATAMLSDFPAK